MLTFFSKLLGLCVIDILILDALDAFGTAGFSDEGAGVEKARTS